MARCLISLIALVCLAFAETNLAWAQGSSSGCPFSQAHPDFFPSVEIYHDQHSSGKSQPTYYDFWFSPCNVSQAPVKAKDICFPPNGYVQQYDLPANNGGICQFSMSVVEQAWTPFSKTFPKYESGFTAKFGNVDNGNYVDVTVLCDASAGNMRADGNATASTDGQGNLHWTLFFRSEYACGSATTNSPGTGTPLPTETPHSPSPVPFTTTDACSAGNNLGCNACLGLGLCGYCLSTGKCEAGGPVGPNSGTCSSWEWYYVNCSATTTTNSPAPFPPTPVTTGLPELCGEQSSKGCKACLNAGPHCGWCQSSQACEYGSTSGPNSGTCSNWEWYFSDCTSCVAEKRRKLQRL